MDSLTHIAIGATIGEFTLGKKAGNKALLYGAVIGSLPDIDVFFTPLLEPTKALLFHRGISHSLLIGLIAIPLIAYLFSIIEKGKNISLKQWLLFTAFAFLSHILIDCFNTYGTGIFEPFNNYRVAYDSMSIINIFFLLPFAIFAIIRFTRKNDLAFRKAVAAIALSTAGLILLLSIINKNIITDSAKKQLKKQGVAYSRLITTPTPLSNIYWAIIAEDDKGFHVGHISIFETKRNIKFDYILRNDSLISSIEQNSKIKNLKRFTNGFYIAEKDSSGTIWMYDLRFSGLELENAKPYVFSYEIKQKKDDVDITRSHPQRHINLTNIRKYFKLIF